MALGEKMILIIQRILVKYRDNPRVILCNGKH